MAFGRRSTTSFGEPKLGDAAEESRDTTSAYVIICCRLVRFSEPKESTLRLAILVVAVLHATAVVLSVGAVYSLF
jgi:hypothetical protein